MKFWNLERDTWRKNKVVQYMRKAHTRVPKWIRKLIRCSCDIGFLNSSMPIEPNGAKYGMKSGKWKIGNFGAWLFPSIEILSALFDGYYSEVLSSNNWDSFNIETVYLSEWHFLCSLIPEMYTNMVIGIWQLNCWHYKTRNTNPLSLSNDSD